MARFIGKVGFGLSVENPPESGNYVPQIIEIECQGDVRRNTRRTDGADKVNEDVVFDHSISVIADEFAIANFPHIKYVWMTGVYWTVTSVENQHPRIIMNLGGVYNGPKA